MAIRESWNAIGCCDGAAEENVKHGTVTYSGWNCAQAKRLAWAVWPTGGHNFPPPTGHSPGANQLIWSFVSKTPLAPVPR